MEAQRERMVKTQLEMRDISSRAVLAAMRRVPRHAFVPAELQHEAYSDCALPLSHGQTISQPYIVALMTQLADPAPNSISLDVGTGCGYQAAVLSELCHEVCSLEIVPALAEDAGHRLQKLGYDNVRVRCADGHGGWPGDRKFDCIVAAAAPAEVPPTLVAQLAPQGRLVIPIGTTHRQQLLVVKKQDDGSVRTETTIPVAFVTMTGAPR